MAKKIILVKRHIEDKFTKFLNSINSEKNLFNLFNDFSTESLTQYKNKLLIEKAIQNLDKVKASKPDDLVKTLNETLKDVSEVKPDKSESVIFFSDKIKKSNNQTVTLGLVKELTDLLQNDFLSKFEDANTNKPEIQIENLEVILQCILNEELLIPLAAILSLAEDSKDISIVCIDDVIDGADKSKFTLMLNEALSEDDSESKTHFLYSFGLDVNYSERPNLFSEADYSKINNGLDSFKNLFINARFDTVATLLNQGQIEINDFSPELDSLKRNFFKNLTPHLRQTLFAMRDSEEKTPISFIEEDVANNLFANFFTPTDENPRLLRLNLGLIYSDLLKKQGFLSKAILFSDSTDPSRLNDLIFLIARDHSGKFKEFMESNSSKISSEIKELLYSPDFFANIFDYNSSENILDLLTNLLKYEQIDLNRFKDEFNKFNSNSPKKLGMVMMKIINKGIDEEQKKRDKKERVKNPVPFHEGIPTRIIKEMKSKFLKDFKNNDKEIHSFIEGFLRHETDDVRTAIVNIDLDDYPKLDENSLSKLIYSLTEFKETNLIQLKIQFGKLLKGKFSEATTLDSTKIHLYNKVEESVRINSDHDPEKSSSSVDETARSNIVSIEAVNYVKSLIPDNQSIKFSLTTELDALERIPQIRDVSNAKQGSLNRDDSNHPENQLFPPDNQSQNNKMEGLLHPKIASIYLPNESSEGLAPENKMNTSMKKK
ncbi:hypothetical protein OAC51_00360 [Flavobacteriaceae bacterium]|nr:hypothetical protein [Flavobacteriaceae bacterium]